MPALILLDMLMPVMDGRRLTDEFRARYGARTPIVVTAALLRIRTCCTFARSSSSC